MLGFLRTKTRRFPFTKAQLHVSSITLSKRRVLQQFRLADIGEGITECEVIKWIVKPATVVQSFDPLCEVQSDKASVEITSPFDGVVKDLLVKEGDVAKVGEGLCLIETEEDVEEAGEEPSTTPKLDYTGEALPPEQVTLSGSPQGNPHPLDPRHRPGFTTLDSTMNNVLATPSVRHFARRKGVNLATIGMGTGKGGRVEKSDVEAVLSSTSQPYSATLSEQAANEIQIEFGRTRFAMWKTMTKSLEVPHFGYSTTLDLTRLSELLPTLNSHIPAVYRPVSVPPTSPVVSPDAIFVEAPAPSMSDPTTHYTRLTLLPLLLKTLACSMLSWPIFRSSIHSIDPSSKQRPILSVRPHVDITIALSTPTGLYTPTLTAVEMLTPYAIMGRLRRLQHFGRQTPCALGPADMPKRGGTITVSNVGAIGRGEYAAPLLFPGGGVAIVAIGRAKWVDVVPENGIGAPRRKLMVSVSWSADHRIIEGAEMAAFVEDWRGWVENPERLIGYAM